MDDERRLEGEEAAWRRRGERDVKGGWWGFDETGREEWINNSAARAAMEWWNFMLMQIMRDVVEFELFFSSPS